MLCMGSQSVELIAKLDTGAAYCIFERTYGEMLGLERRIWPAATLPDCGWRVHSLSTRSHNSDSWNRVSGARVLRPSSGIHQELRAPVLWLDRLRIAIGDSNRADQRGSGADGYCGGRIGFTYRGGGRISAADPARIPTSGCPPRRPSDWSRPGRTLPSRSRWPPDNRGSTPRFPAPYRRCLMR